MAINDPITGSTTWIYALKDPRTGEIRYVGKSDNPQIRLTNHIERRNSSYPVSRWVNELWMAGHRPSLVLLEEVSQGQWQAKERAWVARLLRRGEPLLNRPYRVGWGGRNATEPDEAKRFWKKVDKKNGPFATVDGRKSRCWIRAGTTTKGYARFQIRRTFGRPRYVSAHRWSYEHEIGPIPAGKDIHHKCRNRACVRPNHLAAVFCREHRYNGLKTHCKNGHPLSGDNLLNMANGERKCRICSRQNYRRKYRDEAFRNAENARQRESNRRRRQDPLVREDNRQRGQQWRQTHREYTRAFDRQRREKRRALKQQQNPNLIYSGKLGAPRKRVCGNGHIMDELNVYVDKRGKRYCRGCARDRGRRYEARQRLARKQDNI